MQAGSTTDGNLDESLILEIVADGGKVCTRYNLDLKLPYTALLFQLSFYALLSVCIEMWRSVCRFR
jgi:hypothetical protein